MKIAIRLDVSSEIGIGHIKRCLNLFENSGLDITFIIKTDNQQNLLFQDLNIIFLDDEIAEFKLFLQYQIREFDILILDLLKYSEGYIKEVYSLINRPLVVFHEYEDYQLEYCDLAINYNFFNNYRNNQNKNLLAGPEYFIFNNKLLEYKENKNSLGIFITFGGADPSGLTIKLIKECIPSFPDIEFKIHIGPFFKYKSCLEKIQLPQNIQLLVNPQDIYSHMSQAKIIITAGGTTMYESLYLNKEIIVISHNAHQSEFAKNAAEEGVVSFLGDKESFNSQELIKVLSRVNENFLKRANTILDGKGKQRILEKIRGLLS